MKRHNCVILFSVIPNKISNKHHVGQMKGTQFLNYEFCTTLKGMYTFLLIVNCTQPVLLLK